VIWGCAVPTGDTVDGMVGMIASSGLAGCARRSVALTSSTTAKAATKITAIRRLDIAQTLCQSRIPDRPVGMLRGRSPDPSAARRSVKESALLDDARIAPGTLKPVPLWLGRGTVEEG
jgi:hypothetical protein